MGKVFNRIVALFIIFVTCFSCSLSAYALTVDDAVSFGKWVSSIPYTPGDAISTAVEWWQNHVTDSDDTSVAYSDYVSSVQSALGTSTVGDNCVYLGNWSDYVSSDVYLSSSGSYTFSSGSTFVYSGNYTSTQPYRTYSARCTFVAPVSGDYVFTPYVSSNNGSLSVFYLYSGTPSYFSTTPVYSNNSPVSGTSYTVTLSAGNEYTLRFEGPFAQSKTGDITLSGAVRMEYPTGGLTAAAGDVDVSSSTRTGSLAGDMFYEGNDGKQVAAENATLFDETNNTVNNYQTGTTATASSWTYDYATRTYTITATDGSTYTIRYGDDQATQTVKDSAGASTTYNYYYGSGSSSSGGSGDSSSSSGGSSSGGTIWDKIGDLFGTIADGALTVIKAAVSKILDGLIDLCEMINKKLESVVNSILGLFDQIPKLFSGFTAFLAAVFPFIPVEIQNVLLLAVCLLALIAIINAIRRR
jgi:uncharacterized membrane protein YgcG